VSGTTYYWRIVAKNAAGSAPSATWSFTTFINCTYSLNPTGASLGAAGGINSVSVTAPAACAWNATTNAVWLAISSGASGAGDGTVQYTGSPNATGANRSGTLTIAGQTFTITQPFLNLTNFIAKFVDPVTVLNSAMSEINGFVGISTTVPAISLDVRTGSLPQMGIAGVTDYLTFFASDVFGPAIYWDPMKDMRFGRGGASLYNPYGFVEQMRIQSSTGNVGFGTMTPGFKLDVAGDSNFTGSIRYQANPMLQSPGGLAGSNIALGLGALENITTGTNNTAVGFNAANLVTGGNSNNVHLGSQGVAGDSGVIRIGTPGTQSSFFAAGVRGVTTGSNSAIGVVIDAAGQLGTLSSSRRFKENVQDMGALSPDLNMDLLRLRPVTFRYKQPFADGAKPVQYGLIAEDVARVFPDLVAHSADGLIETVKYQVLGPMLLNGVQLQQAEIRRLKQEIARQQQENESLQERLIKIEAALASLSSAKKTSAGQ
jgi:hypothetical protein